MQPPPIEPNETRLSYLLRVIATDALPIALRQRAADKAVRILRKSERNYDASAVWRLAKLVQLGAKFAPDRPPHGYAA